MQLSKKPKSFCCIFIAYLEPTLDFEYFEKEKKKKKGPHSLSISEIVDFERYGYLNA